MPSHPCGSSAPRSQALARCVTRAMTSRTTAARLPEPPRLRSRRPARPHRLTIHLVHEHTFVSYGVGPVSVSRSYVSRKHGRSVPRIRSENRQIRSEHAPRSRRRRFSPGPTRAGVADYLAENFVEVVGSRLVGRESLPRSGSAARVGCAHRCSCASKPAGHCANGVFSGCVRDAAASVTVQGERVDHERVAEKVEGLAVVADAMGAAEPEGVVKVAVD